MTVIKSGATQFRGDVGTTAKVADITMMEACLHGEEVLALGDRGYHKANRTIEHFVKKGDLSVLTPTKKPAGGELTEEHKTAFNRMLSSVRAIVEHPFRVVKRQFGFVKVRCRGLAKNTGQIVTLFALANLWLVRKRLLPLMGEVRPSGGYAGENPGIPPPTVENHLFFISFMTIREKVAGCSENPYMMKFMFINLPCL